MVRSASIGIRLEPALKEAIEAAAQDDHRPVASLIEKVMIEWLTERGYLSAAPAKKAAPKRKAPRR
jgi:hypothetical protein